MMPFIWSFGITNPTLCSNPLLDELGKLLHAKLGLRMLGETKTRWHGNLQEILVGSLTVILADGDELGHLL